VISSTVIGAGATLVSGALSRQQLLAAAVLNEFAPESSRLLSTRAPGIRGNHDGSFSYAHRLRGGEGPDSFGVQQTRRSAT
jgi:hypothetical protein